MKKKKVVVVGGGTGTIAVLSKLKDRPDLDISVIVSMTDDGGSNAIIRDEFGLLPLSDLRKSIIALSEIGNGILRELFVYRFAKGTGLHGHTLGNLMMTALTDITGSELKSVEATSKLFRVKGKVLPVTLEQATLVADYENGKRIKGEHLIDEPVLPKSLGRIKRLSLTNQVHANPAALHALAAADVIIAGPGDLYTTTLANLIVPGVPAAIRKSKGVFIFVSNLMSKQGQTTGMTALDLIDEITKYSTRAPDAILLHAGGFPPAILKKYAAQNEHPIEDDVPRGTRYQVVRANLIKRAETKKDKGDTLVRSLIRHDASKLARAVYKIITQSYGN